MAHSWPSAWKLDSSPFLSMPRVSPRRTRSIWSLLWRKAHRTWASERPRDAFGVPNRVQAERIIPGAMGYLAARSATTSAKMMVRDDTDLVRRAADGDGDAFGVLVERHAGWLLARVAGKLGRRHDAEDLVQESLLAAYRQLPELKEPEPFGPGWRASPTTRCGCAPAPSGAASLAGGQQRGRGGLLPDREVTLPAGGAKPGPPSLGRLTPVQREVVVHHYLKGYSYQQVASFLGVGVDTVRSRLQRARRRLHQEVIAMPELMPEPMQFELADRDARALSSAIGFISRDPQRLGALPQSERGPRILSAGPSATVFMKIGSSPARGTTDTWTCRRCCRTTDRGGSCTRSGDPLAAASLRSYSRVMSARLIAHRASRMAARVSRSRIDRGAAPAITPSARVIRRSTNRGIRAGSRGAVDM